MLTGDRDDLLINGIKATDFDRNILLLNESSSTRLTFRYLENRPFEQGDRLSFNIVVTDRYGHQLRYPLSYELFWEQ